jgi:hypothetical protein
MMGLINDTRRQTVNLATAEVFDSERMLLAALRYARQCYRGEHLDKTIVVGCGPGATVAFAAGLSSHGQQKFLVSIARYLFAVNNTRQYFLMMPAWSGPNEDQEVLAIECASAQSLWHCVAPVLRDEKGVFHDFAPSTLQPASEPLMENLLLCGHSIPGIMRREFDQAYADLRIDPQDICRFR